MRTLRARICNQCDTDFNSKECNSRKGEACLRNRAYLKYHKEWIKRKPPWWDRPIPQRTLDQFTKGVPE